jgi:hemerythrin-like domain-containing protein
VRRLHEANKKGETLERLKHTTRRHGRVQEVMRNYEQVMRTLARSDRGEDRQLAADLVRYLSERSRDVSKPRSPERDRSP